MSMCGHILTLYHGNCIKSEGCYALHTERALRKPERTQRRICWMRGMGVPALKALAGLLLMPAMTAVQTCPAASPQGLRSNRKLKSVRVCPPLWFIIHTFLRDRQLR